MIAEPAPMGTAASLAWGVAEIRRRAGDDAVICATHADLAISFLRLFHDSLQAASALARREDSIVLLGLSPTRVETGFGYIVPSQGTAIAAGDATGFFGAAHAANEPIEVAAFVEKPSAADAERLISEGALWHSGIFVARVRTIANNLLAHTPEVAGLLSTDSSARIESLAGSMQSISLERGLSERCRALKALPVEFGWDDVGTWASLRRARELDDAGNGTVGEAYLVDASANVVHSENGVTVLYGVDKLLVVRLNDVTFVTTLERAGDLRPLLDALPPELRRRTGR
jgi:mannose-1-phosphate guanylyltransferase